MTTPSQTKRLGFFTRLLDDVSASERYRLATEQIVHAEESRFQLSVGRPAPLPSRRREGCRHRLSFSPKSRRIPPASVLARALSRCRWKTLSESRKTLRFSTFYLAGASKSVRNGNNVRR